MNRIFIGYDPRQVVSYTTLQQSIISHATKPVSITPLVIETLPISAVGLTPFTFSRFLVPWLCDYEGWALFLDADIILRDDVSKLFDLAKDHWAVMVSKNELKFEWSSVMLFNNRCCTVLTPERIEEQKGLHKIEWTDAIGELPPEWNHLVGYDEPRDDAKLVHYTQGIPAFPETMGCEYTQDWMDQVKVASSTKPWHELMGNSVHAKPVYDRLVKEGKISEELAPANL